MNRRSARNPDPARFGRRSPASGTTPPGRPAGAGLVSRSFAATMVALRFLVVPGWIAAALAATLFLPGIRGPLGGELTDLIPEDSPAVQAEVDSVELFDLPLLARSAVVQHEPTGLSVQAQARAVLTAVNVSLRREPGLERIGGALPIPNTFGLVPGSKQASTTVVTYLFYPEGPGLREQVDLAHAYAARIDRPDDALIGVTGPAPARLAQADLIQDRLPWVEGATVLLIALIVGITFRSVGAPLATLLTAAVAYLVAIRVVAWAGERYGLTVPQDLEPLIVVLLLGIVTDYSVFFLARMRRRLGAGDGRLEAARRTTAEFLPIIVTAGLIVAGGTAALVAARLGFLRVFGPGLALTVLVSLLVAVTLMPGLLGMFGGALFWPRSPAAMAPPGYGVEADRPRRGWRERLFRVATARPAALVLAAVVLVALIVPALEIGETRLGFKLVDALPGGSEEVRAQAAANQGFASGILSPTLVLVRRAGLDERPEALAKLEDGLGREPGVAAVVGPQIEDRLADLARRAEVEPDPGVTRGVFLSDDGAAARFLLMFDSDPLGAEAIHDLERIRDRMPELLRTAGLADASVEIAGNTALAQETIDLTLRDLARIAVAALLLDLILLVIFLRALVAPLLLLSASVLALAAALGLTVFVFQVVLHHSDLTYYVPIAAAVLLVSLGSDYNVFVVGRIWEEARTRPLREAIAVGAPGAARAIAVAALALAGSFALLVLVPLVQFREFAFAMVAGVLIDSFLVRSVLVPALIALFGTASGWPSRRLRTVTSSS